MPCGYNDLTLHLKVRHMDQAVWANISWSISKKKYAFVKILFRICRVGIGKPCIFKKAHQVILMHLLVW